MINYNRLFEIDSNTGTNEVDTIYTKKVNIPQYLPKNEKPSIYSLMDRRKYDSLILEINSADLPEEEKEFLRLAAGRHILFNYSLIADYYANSNKEMQELMEKQALVIIDFDDAIANGYVKLSESIKNLYNDGLGKD